MKGASAMWERRRHVVAVLEVVVWECRCWARRGTCTCQAIAGANDLQRICHIWRQAGAAVHPEAHTEDKACAVRVAGDGVIQSVGEGGGVVLVGRPAGLLQALHLRGASLVAVLQQLSAMCQGGAPRSLCLDPKQHRHGAKQQTQDLHVDCNGHM